MPLHGLPDQHRYGVSHQRAEQEEWIQAAYGRTEDLHKEDGRKRKPARSRILSRVRHSNLLDNRDRSPDLRAAGRHDPPAGATPAEAPRLVPLRSALGPGPQSATPVREAAASVNRGRGGWRVIGTYLKQQIICRRYTLISTDREAQAARCLRNAPTACLVTRHTHLSF